MRRQLVVVFVLTALSQAAAFLKLWFTARIFGIGAELDGYNLALVAPTLLAGVLSGVIQTGFFPVRARIIAEQGLEIAGRFERVVFWVCICIGLILMALLLLMSQLLALPMTSQEQPAVREIFLQVMPYVVLLLPLSMACDCLGYILAMRNKFSYAAGAPILNGLVGAAVLYGFSFGEVTALVYGTVLGTIAQLAVCWYGLRAARFSLLGAGLKIRESLAKFREMAHLGGWILPGVIFTNMLSALPPVWAAAYGEGVVSTFGYAYRLHTSVIQLLIMSSSTLVLARFSTLVAEGNEKGIRSLLWQAAGASSLIGVLGAFLVWWLGAPLLRLVFGGRFDAVAAEQVAELWFWLTIGVGFVILSNVFAKLWQAQSRPRLMSLMAALSLLAVYLSYSLLKGYMGVQAIALALMAAPVVIVFFAVSNILRPRS